MAAASLVFALALAAAPLGAPPALLAQDAQEEDDQVGADPVAQRRALLGVRSQARALQDAVDALIEALGPDAIPPRERPAMMECPWEMPEPEPPPEEEEEQGRRSVPECHPPGWEPPTDLEEWEADPLPEDRPAPLVDDYFSHVVRPPPPDLVERFDLDTTYYKKHADATGYPILASGNVRDEALLIVRDQVNYMLAHRPDVREAIIENGGRIVIMAETEYTMDIPEQRDWIVPRFLDARLTEGERSNYYEPGGLGYRSAEAYWNARARGMGGTLTSCAEENVLGYYDTRYWGANICVHEFAHGIMGAGIANADPEWYQEIVDAYRAAREQELPTARGYAGNTFNEYWAVNLEWYLGTAGRDRAELKALDPVIYELFTRLIPETQTLPGRANVADRSEDEMNALVRERNPEWWERERARREEERDGDGGG